MLDLAGCSIAEKAKKAQETGPVNGQAAADSGSTALRYALLGSAAGNQFVEQRLALFGAQDATEALDIFAPRTIAADDDRHAAIRHIHPLVQHTSGSQLGILAGTETFEDRASFLGGRLVGNARQAEAAADLGHHLVIFREEQHLIGGVQLQKPLDLGILERCVHRNIARLAPGQQGGPRLGIARAQVDQLALKILRCANKNAPALQKRAINLALLSVARLVLRQERDIDALLAVLRQVAFACEFGGRAAIDLWADEKIQVFMRHIAAFGSGA